MQVDARGLAGLSRRPADRRLLGVLTRRDRLWLPLTALGAGLVGVLIGVGSHAWQPAEPTAKRWRCWPAARWW